MNDPFTHRAPVPVPTMHGVLELPEDIGQTTGDVPIGVLGGGPGYRVAFQLRCERDEAADAYVAWQRGTWQLLADAAARARRRYDRLLVRRIALDSRDRRRQLVTGALERRVIELLAARGPHGGAVPPAITGGLAWEDMTWTFSGEPPDRDGAWPSERLRVAEDDRRFAEFLQAAWARVLVPVRPGHEEAVLAWLWFGARWPGVEDTTPVLDADAIAIYELAHPAPPPPPTTWTVDVPTTELVVELIGPRSKATP